MRCIHSTPVLPQLSHVMAAQACYGWFTSFDLHFPAAEDLFHFVKPASVYSSSIVLNRFCLHFTLYCRMYEAMPASSAV